MKRKRRFIRTKEHRCNNFDEYYYLFSSSRVENRAATRRRHFSRSLASLHSLPQIKPISWSSTSNTIIDGLSTHSVLRRYWAIVPTEPNCEWLALLPVLKWRAVWGINCAVLKGVFERAQVFVVLETMSLQSQRKESRNITTVNRQDQFLYFLQVKISVTSRVTASHYSFISSFV